MSKTKRIAEWIFIGLFVAIVASVASILIYRSVVNSDWYTERQARKSHAQMVEKINDTDNIKYVEIEFDDGNDLLNIYDVPAELFDDLKIIRYEQVDDIEKLLALYRSEPCITVFFNDNTATPFYIAEDGKLYWGALFEVDCPSLLDWFNEVINENK